MANRPALQHRPHACLAAASSLPCLRSHAKASRHQCAIAAASCLISHAARTTMLTDLVDGTEPVTPRAHPHLLARSLPRLCQAS